MLFSAHLFDTNPRIAMSRVAPNPSDAPGLLSAWTGSCAPFDESYFALPQLGREFMIAAWEDEENLDQYLERTDHGREMSAGWHVRLELVRAIGMFPGLDMDLGEVAGDKAATMTGPSVALTLGKAHIKTIPEFFYVNKGLERQFLVTPEGRWGTACTNLKTRFVATITVWDSLSAATDYVRQGAHGDAVKNHSDLKKDPTGHKFATGGGFLGFRPLSMHGEVTGRNAVSETLLATK